MRSCIFYVDFLKSTGIEGEDVETVFYYTLKVGIMMLKKELIIAIVLNNVILLGFTLLLLLFTKQLPFMQQLSKLFELQNATQTIIATLMGAVISILILVILITFGKANLPKSEGADLISQLIQHKYFAVFAIAASPAFIEELLFRGVLQTFLLRFMHPAVAVLLVAIIFTCMHYVNQYKGQPYLLMLVFVLSVITSIAFQYTGNLWAPIFIHFIYNFVCIYVMRKKYIRIT